MGDSSDILKTPTSQEIKPNEIHSSPSVSPESTISSSRGSTPSFTNVVTDKGKMVDWWRRVALNYSVSPMLKTENWMQAFHDVDTEETKDELIEEFQEALKEHLKTMEEDEKKRHYERLKEQLHVFEENKMYEVRKTMNVCDKNQRFEWLSGQFMEDTKLKFKEALKQKEHSIFAEEWRVQAENYEKGTAVDMDNRLRNEMGRTLEKTNRMFRNTAQELAVNKQVNIEIAENNIQSYATRLSSNCDDRKYYLQNTITEYLSQERKRRDLLLQQHMEKETRTLRREVEQLKKQLGYGPARRCCATLCVIM